MPSAKIDTASSGDNTIVAGVSDQTIRVWGYDLVCSSANAVKWRDGTTDLEGAKSFAANGGISRPCGPEPVFTLTVGNALTLNLGTAAQVSGSVQYSLMG